MKSLARTVYWSGDKEEMLGELSDFDVAFDDDTHIMSVAIEGENVWTDVPLGTYLHINWFMSNITKTWGPVFMVTDGKGNKLRRS